ncbi:thioredoxin-like protein [Tricharina praecox]|uniref:thioredoxin-like protein n=1 Tax=Tricharina praecox TaxID=43433 RepID=UPI002220CF8C|nr:thioredoxin-like protein [Tricharina praecox]KAI5846062.1 thioredoxin-like protein [Tricharina praecox]
MFRFHKTLDVLTLFHSPSNPQSAKVLNLLKSASAHATDSSITGKNPTASFELDVIEAPTVPTPDQLRSILEFIGPNKIGDIVKGAKSESEAVRMLKQGGEVSSEKVLRPLLVDWNNGRVVLGGDEKAIQKLVETLPK